MGGEQRDNGGDEGFSDFFSEDDFVDAPSEERAGDDAQSTREKEDKPAPDKNRGAGKDENPAESKGDRPARDKDEGKARAKDEGKASDKDEGKPRDKDDKPSRAKSERTSPEPSRKTQDDKASPRSRAPRSEQAPPKRPAPTGGAPAIVRFGLPILFFLIVSVAVIAYGRPSGEQLLADAAQSFGKIDRGIFSFEITVSPRGDENVQPASISLSGPFELPPDSKLPVAHIDYTISSGGQEQTTTLIMTGDKAYVEIRGQAFELPPEATKDLEKASADLRKKNKQGGSTGLAGVKLDFDKWLTDPKVRNGGEVGGQKTWEVEAGVDIVEALTDLLAQAKALGSITGAGQLPAELSKQDAQQLKKLIERAYVTVNVGKYDGLLRRFDLTMDVKPPADGKKTSLLTSGRANLVIGISDPNQPVDVEPPKDPLPYSALESLTQAGQSGGQSR